MGDVQVPEEKLNMHDREILAGQLRFWDTGYLANRLGVFLKAD